MKKGFFFALIAGALVFGAVAPAYAQALKDGVYFAQQDGYDAKTGWKDMVTLEVKSGKIVKAEWNGVNLDAPLFKREWAKAGKYGMIKASKIGKEWNDQAAAVEAYLVKTQDVGFSKYSTPEGNTDAITGASMHVKPFFDLAKKAVAAGPMTRGAYKDGVWHAEAADFTVSGWKGTIDILVKNGLIVSANWNGVDKSGTLRRDAVRAGKYVMKAGGVTWNAQAATMAAYLMGTQDPVKITYKDNAGHVDAVSGVSISVKEFFDLAAQALKTAK